MAGGNRVAAKETEQSDLRKIVNDWVLVPLFLSMTAIKFLTPWQFITGVLAIIAVLLALSILAVVIEH